MERRSRSIAPTLTVALIANVLIFYFIFAQIGGIKSIANDWEAVKSRYLTTAINLTEVERSFGYVGFIHHFKNYIIRRSDKYYLEATKSHDQVSRALANFRNQSELSAQELGYIDIIEQTIDEYRDKLNYAKALVDNHSASELDTKAKVDDSHAANALNELRSQILPRLRTEKNAINKKVQYFSERTLFIGLSLIPLFLFSTLLTVLTLRRQSTNVNELTAIFNASPDGIMYIDGKGNIRKVNEAALRIFDYNEAQLLALHVNQLVDAEHSDENIFLELSSQSISKQLPSDVLEHSAYGITKSSQRIPLKISVVGKQLGKELIHICVIKDMTTLHALKEDSDRDHLTSLGNRRHFDSVIQNEINRTKDEDAQASLLLIDLDNFKTLNDDHGHLEGDKALKQSANFLLEHARDCDFISRWGGDEFVILCPGLSQQEACEFAEQLRSGFEKLQINPSCPLTLSIGISTTDSYQPLCSEGIIAAADKAVYQAKNKGKNQVVHHDHI